MSIVSGDDELLMHRIYQENKRGVLFLKSVDALVQTAPNTTLSQLINQRRRWASKWKAYQLPYSKWLAISIVLFHLLNLFGIVASIMGYLSPIVLVQVMSVRLVVEYYFLHRVASSLQLSISIPLFLLMTIIYPFYAIFIGVTANFGRFTWKERTYTID